MRKPYRKRWLLTATALVVAGALWLLFRQHSLLPEEALVRPQTAAFIVYTAAAGDPGVLSLLDQQGGAVSPSQRRLLQPSLKQIKRLLPLRVIALLGPARGADRPVTIAVSFAHSLAPARLYLAEKANPVEIYHGRSIMAPRDGPGFITQTNNQMLWSSDQRELQVAIDRLAVAQPLALPQRFSDLRSNLPNRASGALYLFNDGQPFSIPTSHGGATRLRLPSGFIGMGFNFDLKEGNLLSGTGRLRFRNSASAAAQIPSVRALLDGAASQVSGKLSYQIEASGAADLSLTVHWSGVSLELAQALAGTARALQPNAGLAAARSAE